MGEEVKSGWCFTARSISKGIENRDSNRYLHANVCGRIIPNSQKMAMTWVSTTRRSDKQITVYMYDGVLLSLKQE